MNNVLSNKMALGSWERRIFMLEILLRECTFSFDLVRLCLGFDIRPWQVLEHPWMRAVVGSAEWKHVQERGERFVDAPTTLHSTEGKDAELQEASFGGAQVSAKWAALHDRQCHILHRLAGLEGRTEQCGPGG
jgi:hypothetical protein